MRLPILFASSALFAASVGCLQSVDYVDPIGLPFDTSEGTVNSQDIGPNVRQARLSGQYGPQDTFQDAAAATSGYDDGATSNVVLETSSNGRMGMMIIDSWQGSLLTMPAGSYQSSSTSLSNAVNVTICATDFDAPAEDAVVDIQDTPDGRVITVEAQTSGDYGLDNSDNPALASFTVVR